MLPKNLAFMCCSGALSFLSAACGAAPRQAAPAAAAPTAAASPELAVVGGTPLSQDNPGRSSAVALTSNGKVFCSGVLAADDLVLTAAHCVLLSQVLGSLEVQFTDDVATADASAKRSITASASHPQFRLRTAVFSDANYDIGWVKFTGGLPPGYAPALVLADPGPLVPGTGVTLVGFGDTGQRLHDAGTRLTTDTVVNRYLDDATHVGLLVLGPTPGHSDCLFDSGGPAYLATGGAWAVVGLTSAPDHIVSHSHGCDAGAGVDTFPGRHIAWIEQSSGEALLTP